MSTAMVYTNSLKSISEQISGYLIDGRDTALVAAPGSGVTSLVRKICDELNEKGLRVERFQLTRQANITGIVREIREISESEKNGNRVAVIFDHDADLPESEMISWLSAVRETVCGKNQDTAFLWAGALDARKIINESGFRIHASPRTHITFPVPDRDDLIGIYRHIAKENDCQWGEAILFLLLDLCGNDLSLVAGIAEYLHGDWTKNLYDASVWDRIHEWLGNDPRVDHYRRKLKDLPESCQRHIALFRLGGKPPCRRKELLEEIDDALRSLSIQGFIIPNLLPGFYQIRNLAVRFLIYESHFRPEGFSPRLLFRKATNERAALILQDAEMMFRSMLFHAFQLKGESEVLEILEKKQSDREFVPANFRKALFNWSKKTDNKALHNSLIALVTDYQNEFKKENSLWAQKVRLMNQDREDEVAHQIPEYLRCIDYLSFNELGVVLIDLLPVIFPNLVGSGQLMNSVETRWREGISKVIRLRNRVAHLRNVDFQDMEDLAGIVRNMREDVIKHAGW